MKDAMLAICMAFITCAVVAGDLTVINEDGATCDIPKTYNAATFDELYNIKGMKEFCVFPLLPLEEELQKRLEECPVLPYPICNDGLVVSPSYPIRPCYRLVE